jgi:iron complex outermembrane receptor protein
LNRVLFGTTALAVLGGACTAMAQGVPSANGQVLEEVVVTAQRRSERLVNVPMSITALTPQTIERAGINNFMQLGNVVVGAQMGYAGSVPGVAVRGVTSSIGGYNIETNVAVYIDGFYDPQPLTMQSDIANLQSIEVLKGPQGTLYGRNATGGAILINTLGPTKELTGKADVSYGAYNDWITNGYIAGPINDRVRYSLSAHYQHGDTTTSMSDPKYVGVTDGPAAQFAEASIRGKLQADITENLEATLGLNWSFHNDPRTNFYPVFGHVLPPPFFPAPPTRPSVFGTTAYVGSQPKDFAKQYEETLKLAYKTPIGTLTSYTGFSQRDFGLDVKFASTYQTTGNGYPFLLSVIRYKEQTFQQAVDYTITAIDKLDLNIGGLYYQDAFKSGDGTSGAPTNYTFGILGTSAHTTQHSKSWALYIDGTYHVTDKLSLNAGGRFSHDYRNDYYNVTGPAGNSQILTPGTYGAATWTKFTPRATIRYEVAPRENVYFSWSEGYREGAFNPAGPICLGAGPAAQCVFPAAPPETITAYEIGFKGAWSRLQFNTAFFHYNYKNLQIVGTVPNPFNPLQLTSALQSAPQANINGWDAELTAIITPELTAHFGIEWLHARFGTFTNASGTGVDPTNSVNVSGETQDWTGLQMARAPNFSGNAGFDYTVPMKGGTFLLTTNLHYTTAYPVSNADVYGPLAPVALQHEQRFLQGGYVLLSAQASWTDPTNHWTFTIYGDNLANVTYRNTYNGAAFGDFSVRADPITGGVRVGYKF